MVPDEERRKLALDLLNATPGLRRQEIDEGGWFKVDFETVPELVESRRVLLKAGKAYVPAREQMSMVLEGFSANLEDGLEVRTSMLLRVAAHNGLGTSQSLANIVPPGGGAGPSKTRRR